MKDPIQHIVEDTLQKGKQALIFLSTKPSAEKTAEDISRSLGSESKELAELSEEILHDLGKPTEQCRRLAYCVKRGIAYHHAGLTHGQRERVEDGFRNGLIKVICSTPTLAYGIDIPAFRSIIKGVQRYGGKYGMQWIPVLDYMQMAGRAGRPKYDKVGEALLIAGTQAEAEKLFEKYLQGQAEPLYSKLAVEPVLRTYLLSLISAGFAGDKQGILSFFGKTFWAHQYRDMASLQKKIEKMLGLLERWGFIEAESAEFMPASSLKKAENRRYEATALGKRVAELYLDPQTAHHFLECMGGKEATEFGLAQAISWTLELRPLLRHRQKEFDLLQEKLGGVQLLVSEPNLFDPEYDEFIDSVKTAMFFMDWMEEKDDDYLLNEHRIRPGETRVKLATADWLLYAFEEFAKILKKREFQKKAAEVRIRLKYGVKSELLPLLRLEGIGRVRARKLFNFGIKDIGDVKNAGLTTLSQLLGKETALRVKKQVGQEIEAVPDGKRKGQVSLGKF